jgi:ubiquinone/menaquinone biosynthesis C-methylase UbiE
MSSSNQQKHQSWNPLRQMFLRPFQSRLIRTIGSLPVDTILEVGAGEGFVMELVQKSLPDVKLRGLDIQPEAVAEGKRLFPQLDLQVGDIYHIPEPERSWDLLLASEVLEHLEHPEQAIVEMQRVSKRYVLLSVPNEPWFRMLNFARGKHWSRLGNHPEHKNTWTRGSFVKLVKQHLRIEKVINAFPWTIILARV